MQHLGVLGYLRVFALFAADKVGVIDYRRQRGFDVVRDVRYKLGLHSFAFHALVDRFRHAVAYAVQVLRVLFVGTGKVLRANFMFEITVSEAFRAGEQRSERYGSKHHRRKRREIHEDPDDSRGVRRIARRYHEQYDKRRE